MWYLTEEKEMAPQGQGPNKPSPRYWLGGVTGGGRTIGRKHVDIRLKASSVSRTHAKITVLKAAFYSPSAMAGRRRHQSTCVSVQDSSAYGTFLKYPPGHASNRTETAAGHHRRLDKDTPTDVSEGALLAFGAPSAWWRLGWHHVVIMPSRLSGVERARLAAIAAATAVECVDTWAEDVTHMVTSECIASSMKFLTALVEGKHVVTMAWVEAIRHTVGEACRAITDAANEDAAIAACSLSDERLFLPPFSPADQVAHSAEDLAMVFDPVVKGRRASMLRGVVFAFSREERRSRWAAIIEILGGTSMLANVGVSAPDGRVVFVQGEQSVPRKPQEPADVMGRAYVQESALVAAILRADLSPLDTAPESMKPATAAEVTDVATPGPLDESDADTDDSEPTDSVKKQGTRQAMAMESAEAAVAEVAEISSGQELSRSVGQQNNAKKRARVSPEVSPRPLQRKAVANVAQTSVVVEDNQVTPAKVTVDNADVNERAFFKVDDIAPAVQTDQAKDGKQVRGSGRDVRMFRRRNLPSAKVIPLKRVRYERTEAGGFDGAVTRADTRRRGNAASSGAQVVDSEEE